MTAVSSVVNGALTDPVAVVWEALAAADCEPHGRPWDFRAKCPAHSGDNRDALHVSIGADGSAVLWCFAHQCSADRVVHALGLTMGDLFPAGHRHARRRQLAQASRADFGGNARVLVNVLLALEQIAAYWDIELRTDCAHCGSPAALLRVSRRFCSLSCPGDTYASELGYAGCTARQFQEALAGRIENRRRT